MGREERKAGEDTKRKEELPVKMAVQVESEKDQMNSVFNEKDSLEQMVKSRLYWNHKTWIEKGENGTRIHKVVNSLKYWSEKLEKAFGENNVIVGLYNETREVSLSLLNIIDELDKMKIGVKIVGYNTFRNPRYVNIVFDSSDAKKFVERNLKVVGDADVIYLKWGRAFVNTTIKLHWVPFDLPLEFLKTFIDKYATIVSFGREELKLLDGRVLKNGTMAFQVVLREGVDRKDIPHLALLGGLELLVNVTGREVLCLTCNKLGHKSSECDSSFCKTCKAFKLKGHQCINSLQQNDKNDGVKVELLRSNLMISPTNSFLDNKALSDSDVQQINDSALKLWAKSENEDKHFESKATQNTASGIVYVSGSDNLKELSEEDSQENESDEPNDEFYTNMKTHFEELEKFKEPWLNVNEGENVVKKDSLTGNLSETEPMVGVEMNLKRKIGSKIDGTNGCLEQTSNRKTYSRRGGGDKASSKKSEILFDAVVSASKTK